MVDFEMPIEESLGSQDLTKMLISSAVCSKEAFSEAQKFNGLTKIAHSLPVPVVLSLRAAKRVFQTLNQGQPVSVSQI
jgi:hypothetical protein